MLLEFIDYHFNNNKPCTAIPKPLPSGNLQLYVDDWDF